MKQIYLIRHAKSSWKFPSLSDFERPLNKRGKKDAILMGDVLKEQEIIPDLILSSPAERAIKTAKKLAKQLDLPKKLIAANEVIYEASPKTVLKTIQKLPEDISTVFVIGHNPTFTELCNFFVPKANLKNLPTTGIFGVSFKATLWEDVAFKDGKQTCFLTPKMFK